MQNNLLNLIGNLFVYRSPSPLTGERLERFKLMGKSNRLLRRMVPTSTHYSKAQLVERILQKNR
jgi:hypothetical protein